MKESGSHKVHSYIFSMLSQDGNPKDKECGSCRRKVDSESNKENARNMMQQQCKKTLRNAKQKINRCVKLKVCQAEADGESDGVRLLAELRERVLAYQLVSMEFRAEWSKDTGGRERLKGLSLEITRYLVDQDP